MRNVGRWGGRGVPIFAKSAALQRLRNLLLDGAASAPGAKSDARYFSALRARVQSRSS